MTVWLKKIFPQAIYGEILDRYKTEIDELLAECRIMVLEDDLPF